jgi:hypothetical protein
MKKYLAGVLSLHLLLTGCNVSQVVQVINAGVQIAEQAAAVTGLNIPPQYFAYVALAAGCLSSAAAEETTSDSALLKFDKITQSCTQAASVTLPPGTAQNIAALAAKLAKAVQDVLAQVAVKPAPNARTAAPAAAPPSVPTKADVQALELLKTRAEAVRLKMSR